MPDPLEQGGGSRYPSDMESRVAVLEQIARTLAAGQDRIERRFDAVEHRIDALTAKQHGDFRWLLRVMLGGFGAMLGVMAHGFHWL